MKIKKTYIGAEPVSVADAKLYARIDTSETDALVGELIETARKMIEGRLNISVIETDIELVWDEYDGGSLPYGPVRDIIDTNKGDVGVKGAIDIEYKAGFEDTPEDIQTAIKRLVKALYDDEEFTGWKDIEHYNMNIWL